MNAFDAGRMVEARAMARILPFLEEQSNGRLVLTDKGRLAPFLQQIIGDVLFNARGDGRMYAVEVKSETRWTGNLFLEVWSNRNLEKRENHARLGSNPGWLFKLQSDLLFYYFCDVDRLLVIDLFSLKRWAFGGGGRAPRLYGYRMAEQKLRDQPNDTWGYLVPVAVLRVELEVPMRELNVQQLDMLAGRNVT
jgi:hypothetical protein